MAFKPFYDRMETDVYKSDIMYQSRQVHLWLFDTFRAEIARRVSSTNYRPYSIVIVLIHSHTTAGKIFSMEH